MNQKGFSLLELLVTLGLVAILSLLLYTGAQSIREKSLQVKCVANLRQVGTDVRLYLTEHNGVLPWLEQPFVTTRWWYRLYSENDFARFDERLICPADRDPYTLSFKPTPSRTLRCSYRFNKQFGYSESTGEPKLGGVQRNLMATPNPARLKMIADSPRAPREGRTHKSADSMGFNGYDEVFGTGRNAMHAGGERANLLFLDGHSELISLQEFDLFDSSPRF